MMNLTSCFMTAALATATLTAGLVATPVQARTGTVIAYGDRDWRDHRYRDDRRYARRDHYSHRERYRRHDNRRQWGWNGGYQRRDARRCWTEWRYDRWRHDRVRVRVCR
ncbi:hypothetical protein HNP60_003325 [Sphingobium sp. B1D3A]|uniref:Uncharacterized protein n=2 Tax=Sphingobium lignivorans TaxID=2735886 RepID=A0ABR6NJR8_9SPHN|nr:hypothetical protein [Sphingobium lignivorans]